MVADKQAMKSTQSAFSKVPIHLMIEPLHYLFLEVACDDRT